jgi:hypothetical protein
MADQNLKVRISAIDGTSGAFRSIGRGLAKVRNAVFSVQTAVVGLAGTAGFGLLVRSTIETNRSFQSLEASLNTFLGSTEKATKAFAILQKFAATTPFSLREVVGGFNRLIAVGINPSIKSLVAFGNVASGVGKSLNQFIEAVADAAVGEFERLKEFGIKAKTQGDQITFTFKGVETTVEKSSAAITDFLVQLGETEFAGAMDAQAKTLNGAFSNLGDAFDGFKKRIGDAGFNEALVNLAGFFRQLADGNSQLAEQIGRFLASGVNMIPSLFINMGKAASFLFESLVFLKKAMIVVGAGIFARAVAHQALAFVRFAAALMAANKAMLLYRAASKILTVGTLATVAVIAQLTGNLDELVKSISFATEAAIDLVDDAFPGLRSQIDQLLPSFDLMTTDLEEMASGSKKFVSNIEGLDEQLSLLVPSMNNLKKEQFGQSLNDYADSAKDLNQNLENTALRGVKSLEDALVGVVNGSMTAKDAFKKMAASIVNDLIRIQIQRSITGNIANILFSAFNPAAATPNPHTRAMGGHVSANRPYMVGERGPELMIPGASGTIIPNNKMGGNGTVVNQTINVSTGVSQTVRAEIMQLMPQISEGTKAAVLDARRRGGSFASAF